MYPQTPFREDRTSLLHEFIRRRPLATVFSSGADGLTASHVPLLLDADRGERGVLRGHLARGNPQCQVLEEGRQVLASFHGPQAYISPSWYPSKRKDSRVVPTWNYLAVHAAGSTSTFDDASSLRALLEELTDTQEAQFDEPWKLDDAPSDYIEQAARGILGFEIRIERIEGIWKMSQNRPAEDQAGAAAGLRKGTPEEQEVADWIERLGTQK